MLGQIPSRPLNSAKAGFRDSRHQTFCTRCLHIHRDLGFDGTYRTIVNVATRALSRVGWTRAYGWPGAQMGTTNQYGHVQMTAWLGDAISHILHHRWFYLAFLLGAIATAIGSVVDPTVTTSIGGDVFYGSYLLFVGSVTLRMTPAELRVRAAADDEGITFIVIITFAAACFSLVSIFRLLNAPIKPDALHLILSLGAAPLAWFVLHTNAAFHYAHAYYGDVDGIGVGQPARGGLKFPATSEPGPWEFIYFAFVIGMTAQVSDVQVESTWMRQRTISHGVVSFFFNTVLIAMGVNVIVASIQSR